MKNSKFDQEILKRMEDATWDTRISKQVINKFNKTSSPSVYKLSNFMLKIALIVLSLGVGLGFISYNMKRTFYFYEESASNKDTYNPALSKYDIKDLDLLLEEEDLNNEYLLNGFVSISE